MMLVQLLVLQQAGMAKAGGPCTSGTDLVVDGHTSIVDATAFSPDGKQFASGGGDKTIIITEVATGATVQTLTGHTGSVSTMRWAPDNTFLASASYDDTVILWNLTTWEPINTFTEHSGPVYGLAISTISTFVVSVGQDSSVMVWNPTSLEVISNYRETCSFKEICSHGLSLRVSAVAISADNAVVVVAVGGLFCIVYGFHPQTGVLLFTFDRYVRDRVNSIAMSTDAAWVVSGGSDKTVRRWSYPDATQLQVYPHPDDVRTVALAFGDTVLVTGCDDNIIRLINVGTGAVIKRVQTPHKRRQLGGLEFRRLPARVRVGR
jgi:WD40 repeat protein